MKLKYKFMCNDLEISNCDYVIYGNRIKEIIKRVQEHFRNLGWSEEEVNNPEIIKKIKSVIRKSGYTLDKNIEKGGKKW